MQIGGSGKRPSINAYMYGEAKALAEMAGCLGDGNIQYITEVYLVTHAPLQNGTFRSFLCPANEYHAPILDFYQIDEAKPIVMEVPVQLEGLAEGVRAGGKLALQLVNPSVR